MKLTVMVDDVTCQVDEVVSALSGMYAKYRIDNGEDQFLVEVEDKGVRSQQPYAVHTLEDVVDAVYNDAARRLK